MKKFLYLSLIAFMALGACSKNDDPEPAPVPTPDPEPTEKITTVNFDSPEIEYDKDGYWKKYLVNENLHLYGFRFNHYITEYGTVEGFVVSKNEDTGIYEPMYTHPYTVVGGGGVNGVGSPYIVATWSTMENPQSPSLLINRNNFETFKPKQIVVNNTTYAYYTMRDGNDFCRKFTAGDWFKLTIHGKTTSGEEKSVDFLLADCTSVNHPEAEIVTQWTAVDLSSLGEVSSIYFTLSSSDSGEWGMNTPGYFAIGSFTWAE